jgi:hypothetical protein
MSRTLDGTALASEPRWQAWQLAVGIFLQSPLVGSGWGTFPGAAFEAGVSPQMTRIGDVWTSSHNIMLSLLSETGLIGALIVLVGLGAWGRSAVQTWRAGACPGMVWIIAIAGVEFLHSLVEFPLWSAHFLALTALVMGTGSATAASPAPRRLLAALAAGGGIMTVALAMALRDHVRLDSSRITGTSTTLAAPATVQRDAETMNDLARGIFAPVAERHILNGLPPGQPPTRETLAMSERLMSYWPSNETAVRRAILLVLDGQRAEGEELLRKSLRSFPSRCEMTRSLLGRARASDPIAIDALLAAATRDIGAPCR